MAERQIPYGLNIMTLDQTIAFVKDRVKIWEDFDKQTNPDMGPSEVYQYYKSIYDYLMELKEVKNG